MTAQRSITKEASTVFYLEASVDIRMVNRSSLLSDRPIR